MIPDGRLLSPRPHFSHGGGAAYDFQRHLLRTGSPLHQDRADLGFLATTLLTIHEMTHWFQHIGTSYGLFRSLLHSSRTSLFLGWSSHLPRQEREALFDRRIRHRRPLIEIDNASLYYAIDPSDSPHLRLAKQGWYDISLFDEFLEDSSIVETSGISPPGAQASVLTDIISYACGAAGFLSEDVDEHTPDSALEWYDFEHPPFSSVSKLEVPHGLTSIALQECAATITELQYMMDSVLMGLLTEEQRRQEIHLRVNALLTTYYGAPLQLFHHIYDDVELLCDRDVLSTITALIFCALSPPLPPLVIQSPASGRRALTWRDLYPPARFVRLLFALPEIGCLSRDADAAETERYIKAISEAAGVNIEAIWTTPRRRIDSMKVIKETIPAFERDGGVFSRLKEEFELAGFEALRAIREHNLILANPVAMFSGIHAKLFVQYAYGLDDYYDFLRPAFVYKENDKLNYHTPQAMGDALLSAILLERLRDDFICGHGAFNDLGVPGIPTIWIQDLDHVIERNVSTHWNL